MPEAIRDSGNTAGFRKKLLGWYRRHQRTLPWRDNPTPYRVWISEIMLQQTQTRTVLRYYDRFLLRFPDVEALARASEPEVLELWAGLGYYSRARNLHGAAVKIMREHPSFPQEFSAILALPGIGRYTAGAICSIAFNQPYPVVDGNIRRVVTRLTGAAKKIPENCFWDLMSSWMPKKNPSSFNQAMMELGALACVPLRPRCSRCPVRTFCRAKEAGIENGAVRSRAGRTLKRIRIVTLVLERRGMILLSRMSGRDLIPGEWGLPWHMLSPGQTAEEAASGLCRSVIGRPIKLEARGQIRHAISCNQITVSCYYGRVGRRIPGLGNGSLRWASQSSARRLMLSSLFMKAIEKTAGSQ